MEIVALTVMQLLIFGIGMTSSTSHRDVTRYRGNLADDLRIFRMIEREMRRLRESRLSPNRTHRDPNDVIFSMTSETCSEIKDSRNKKGKRNASPSLIDSAARWHNKTLIYKIHGFPPSLGQIKTRHAIFRGFQMWSRHSDLLFSETFGNDANLNIRFASGEHGDGPTQAFDGPGNHLAHAKFPDSGEIHFDIEENWVLTSRHPRYRKVTFRAGRRLKKQDTPYNLVHAATHEIGHALGLRHSDVTSAIMYPSYSEKTRQGRVRLHSRDRRDLEVLYGPRALKRKRFMTSSLLLRKTNKHLQPPDPCNTTITASYTRQDQIFFFSGRYYWTLDVRLKTRSKVTKIKEKFPVSKPKVDASCYSDFSERTYIFSGKKYWRFFGNRVESGYPRYSREWGAPSSPNSALHIPGTVKILIFKREEYYVFDEIDKRTLSGYPREIKALLAGVKHPIDSIVLYGGKVHFVSGQTMTIFDAEKLWKKFLEKDEISDLLQGQQVNLSSSSIYGCDGHVAHNVTVTS